MMSDDKKNVKENNVMEIIDVQPESQTDPAPQDEFQEVELTKEQIDAILSEDEKSEIVPLDPLILPIELIFETEGFLKGVEEASELAGKISMLASVGIAPHMYLAHIEQMAIIEMNKEIANTNAEASKNIKKEIEVKNEEATL